MTKIIENITNLIGESPIVQLSHTPKESADIYLKLERFNPGGSVKDRIALSMVKAAERQGLLKPGALSLSQHLEIRELDLQWWAQH